MLKYKEQLTDPNQVKEYLHDALDMLAEEPKLQALARVVLGDAKFWTAPGGKSKHHAYPGGLAIHTAQVLAAAQRTLICFDDVRWGHLFIAVLWHDYRKVDDYHEVQPGEYEYTLHAKRIGHVAASYAAMVEAAHRIGVDEADIEIIGHFMLAHHGRLEWGSPVTPQDTEAWAIHCADMLSAQFSSEANSPPRT